MASARVLTIAAKMVGGSRIEKEAKNVSKAIGQVGHETKVADEQAGKSGHGWELFSKRTQDATKHTKAHGSTLASVGKKAVGYAAGMGAAYGIYDIAKSALTSYGEKAHEVAQIEAAGLTGSTRGAQILLAAYKARGLGMSNIMMESKTLAKAQYSAQQQEEKYALAQKKAVETGKPMTAVLGSKAQAFKDLGINAAAFAKMSGTDQLKMLNERMSNLPPSMDKTRVATELLGRSGVKMLPMFQKGALGITGLEKSAREMLPQMKGGAKGMEEMEKAQAQLSLATEGLKLRLGMALMPVVLFLTKAFTKWYDEISHGKGVFGTLHAVVKPLVEGFGALAHVLGLNIKGSKLLVIVLGALMAIIAIEKIEKYYLMLKNTWVITKLMAVAQAAWDVVVAASTVLWAAFGTTLIWATGGIILLIAAIVLLITHWKQVKAALMVVWNWIKAHWPLLLGILLGPFALAVIEIIKHWHTVLHFVEGLPAKLAAVGGKMRDFVKDSFKGAIDWVINAWNSLHFHLPKVHIPFVGDVGGETIGVPKIPLLGSGGQIMQHGSVIVGDRGPEVLHLPAGARVNPLNSKGNLSQMGGFQGQHGDLHVHVELDRREIASAVLREFRKLEARSA